MGLTALLVLLWVSTVWCDAIKKCCPQGQSLSEEYLCAPSGHEWFYMDFDYGFPDCASIMVTVNQSDVVSCIDNSLETGSYVGLKCRADPFRFPAPEVHYIRKCCAINRTYDAVQQSCWGERVLDSRPPNEFFNVLMSGFEGIVDTRVGAPECTEGYVLADYLVHSSKVRREESESIVFQQFGDQPKMFNPDEVCMDVTERHEILVIRACQPAEIVCRPNGKHTCVWKCCKDGEAYVGNDTLECVRTHRPMEPLKFFNMTPRGPVAYEVSNPAFYHNGPCTEKFVLNPKESPADVYHIGIDGRLFMSTFPNGVGDYCVEDVYNLNESLDGVQVFKCFADYDELVKTQIVVYGYSMLISVVFLFLTLLVYSCLPSLRNLHGKTLMCYLVSLICAFMTHSVIYHWAPEDDSPVALLVCKSIGFIDNFAFTSAFLWLNVISFDIWWTFGSTRPKTGRSAHDRKRLLVYNLFAWGTGSLLTLVAILSQETEWFPVYARADLGVTACWYEKQTWGIYIYFIAPTSISQACNIVFFVLTAHHCAKVRNELQRIVHTNADESRFKADKKKFIMNLKLFIVMGVSWGLENISYWDPNGDTYIFFLSDIANALQGLFIFGIFILKKKVLKAFARKVKEVVGLAEPKAHRPSTSSTTVYTVMGSNTRLDRLGRPPPLRKSCSDSRLSIVKHPPPKTKRNQKGHVRTYSATSNNMLSVVHDYRFKPGRTPFQHEI